MRSGRPMPFANKQKDRTLPRTFPPRYCITGRVRQSRPFASLPPSSARSNRPIGVGGEAPPMDRRRSPGQALQSDARVRRVRVCSRRCCCCRGWFCWVMRRVQGLGVRCVATCNRGVERPIRGGLAAPDEITSRMKVRTGGEFARRGWVCFL